MATLAERARVIPTARAGRVLALAVVLVLALGGVVLLGLTLGTPQLSLHELGVVLGGGGDKLERVVVTQLRVPRVVLGVTAGAMLALAGVLLQDSMRNALAGPDLLGVSAGASVVIAAITIFHLSVEWVLYPWLALGGGMISGTVVLLSMRRMPDPLRLVLMGVAMNALLYALIISIITMGQQEDIGLLYLYLLGSVANRTWPQVQIVIPWAIVGIPLALIAARPLNLLQLGDALAEGLGLRVVRTRILLMLLSAGLVAAVVAVAGPIAYVSLVAPHIARRLLGTPDARLVLPFAALIGAILLAGADLLAKNLFDPLELPVGIWTTLVGGPLLIVLLRRELGRQRGRP